jgi:hypothetical protein
MNLDGGNLPPEAADDRAVTSVGNAVTVDVLANDGDLDGDALNVIWSGSGSHGGTAVEGDTVVYTPAGDFEGQDTFLYAISDGRGGGGTGTVEVLVAGDLALSCRPSGESMQVSFSSVTGYQYIVESKTNLLSGDGWQEISGAVVGTNGIVEVPDALQIPQRFYRVKVRTK